MSWTTALTELRALLSDGDTDRYYFRKKCLGETNGTNTRYKTLEFRRVTDFTSAQGVYKNNVLLPVSAISTDILATGEFILNTAPVDGDLIEASYYTQWFTEAELDIFLKNSSRWLSSSDTYANLPSGLFPCALKYAASEAYQKMAERWMVKISEGFKLEDAPKEDTKTPVDYFVNLSKLFRGEALKLRDEYYKRQGRSLQPLFGAVRGDVRSIP